MNFNEIFKMNLSELTLEQFVIVFFILLVFTVVAVIIFLMFFQILSLLVDLICYLVCKNKRLGGWWFKRDLCRYIGSLKHQTIKAPTEKAYYLYYNRLIGAADSLRRFGFIDNELFLKFTAVPSYLDLNHEKPHNGVKLFSGEPGSGMSCHCIMPNNFEKESEINENKSTEERAEVDTDK